MNKKVRFLWIFLTITIILSLLMPSAYALTSKYNFTSNENNNIQMEDEFTYRNDCFTRSSFLGCSHLETLSAQVAIASASWYGENADKYEINYSQNAHNVVGMLNEMGFKNVTTNKYYTLEKEENSAGVAVGYRTVKVGEKDYTLIAIIPRSAGYKQEWAGNFTVEDGDIHFGFKSARDEILRYVKKYIKDNNIQGNLKIWTAGHSRGAAIANMLGGFFAGGGIEYFGNEVTITPEDVYCYTFETPRPIKDGIDKNVELSVSANRTDDNYTNDTPGEAFNYTKGGNANVKSDVYGGIRNLISSNDIFTMLPPESWGFTHYGNDISIDHNKITEEDMLKELSKISPYAYYQYMNGGNPNSFERKTLDLKSLEIVKDNGNYSAMDISTFMKERLNGLTYNANTNKSYKDNNYQEALKSMAGVYGMSMTLFDDEIFEDASDVIVSPLVLSYLSYAVERLQEEGRADNEAEAVAIVIEELLSYFTEEEIDSENFTIDDFVVVLAKYIAENDEEPVANAIISGIVELVPSQYQPLLSAFKIFDKNNTNENEVTIEEGIKAFIKACYYGPDPESEAANNYENARQVRNALYGILYLGISYNYPEIGAIFMEESMQIDHNFKDLVQIVVDDLKIIKDSNGNIIKTYLTLSELADDSLKATINMVAEPLLEKTRNLYGDDYANKLNRYIEKIKANISEARRIVLYFLMYEDGNYSAEKDIKNLTTFVANSAIIPLAHYNEINIAYAKASRNYDCGYEEHTTKYICIKGENQTINLATNDILSFEFNADYDTFEKEGKVFIDNNEVLKDNYNLSSGSTIITFKNEFTKALSIGKHKIKIATDEGDGEVEFTVANSTAPDKDGKDDESKNNNETVAPGEKSENKENQKDNETAIPSEKGEDSNQNNNGGNEKNGLKSSNPKTGDNIIICVCIAVIAIIGTVVIVKAVR